MKLNSNKTYSIATRFMVVFSVGVALILPVGYFVISYQYLMGIMETEAEINAQVVSRLISSNPQLWRYETTRIEELLSRRTRSGALESRRILDAKNILVAESANVIKPPQLKASQEIWDGGEVVGRLEISRSILPILLQSGFLAIFGMFFGLLLYRWLPFQAVAKAGKILEETNDVLVKVMNGSSNSLVVLDLDRNIRMFNQRFESLTGCSREELLGRPISTLFTSDAWSQVEAELRTATEHSKNVMFETVLSRQHGLELSLVCGAVPLSSGGTISGLVVSLDDITERKKAEKELLEKNIELERFTSTVSHDLKSPLVTIKSFAVQIGKDMEAGRHSRIPDDIRRITDAATKMGMLLDDLLELSRIGRMMRPPSEVDMGSLVKDVLAQLAGPLEQKQVEVALQSNLPSVYGDQRRIAEVLQNLVENAIKYMGDHDSPRIEIGAREEGNRPVFFVSDNGNGIDPHYHESIFTLYNKLDVKSEGSGIGLALVKRIVEVHGGTIWVESEGIGKGSTFCFTLAQ